MPIKRIEILRVFLASPSDLGPERNVVATAVSELNSSLAPELGMRVELVRWETHVSPSLGSEPQEVINRQIGDDYDVFIGLLWTRFGTPTAHASAGTIEEFERARAKWAANPDSVSVQFYFKEAPIAPSDIDPDQLMKVQAFRKELSKTALYGVFQSSHDLGRLIRIHLTRLIVRGSRTRTTRTEDSAATNPPTSSASRLSDPIEKADVAGGAGVAEAPPLSEGELKDLAETGLADFVRTSRVLGLVRSRIASLGNDLSRTRAEIVEAIDSQGDSVFETVETLLDSLGNRIDKTAAVLESDIVDLTTHYEKAMTALMEIIEVSAGLGPEGLHEVELVREPLANLALTIKQSLTLIENVSDSLHIKSMATANFVRSTHRLGVVMSSMYHEFESAQALTSEAVAAIEEILAAPR